MPEALARYTSSATQRRSCVMLPGPAGMSDLYIICDGVDDHDAWDDASRLLDDAGEVGVREDEQLGLGPGAEALGAGSHLLG
jgi:hypothetical protein